MDNDKCAEARAARDRAQRDRDAAQQELQNFTGGFLAMELELTDEQREQKGRYVAEEKKLSDILKEKQGELDECEGGS